MSHYLLLISILLYSLIAFQDFRDRAVSWILFPLLTAVNITGSIWYFKIPLITLAGNIAVNTFLVICQLLILQLYFSVRYRSFAPITDRFIGWGDILFYLVLIVTLSPINLCCFHIASLIISLLLAIPVILIKKSSSLHTIPLAGIQSCILIILTATHLLTTSFGFFDEQWVKNYLVYAR